MNKYTYNDTDKYHKLPPNLRKEIIKKHFDKKVNQNQLAKEYGVSREMINRYCRKVGISPLIRRKVTIDKDKIIELYVNEKKSIFQISEIINCTRKRIRKLLEENGIEKKISQRYIWEKEIPNYRLKIKVWAAKVWELDNFKCRWCKVKNTFENRIEAHHIIPVRDMDRVELAFDINNGITLCKKCHSKIHFHEKDFEILFKQLIQTRSSG